MVKKVSSKMTRINDEPFVEEIAKLVHCLPSYFVGDNGHIIRAVKNIIKENEYLKNKIV